MKYFEVSNTWAVMGDFNNVMQANERMGRQVTYAEGREFKECVHKCDLQEMKSP